MKKNVSKYEEYCYNKE